MAAQTIVFFPEGAFGPTNNCVGIGDVLRRRGHRVVFIVEESFAGTLEAKGFEERTMRLAPLPEEPEEPGQFWKDFIRDTAPVFRKSTFDQLGEFILPTWQALVDGARHVDGRLVEILEELAPDVVVEDNVVGFPAIPASGRPWVRIVSCNPLEVKDQALPPTFSGLPLDDPSEWDAFRTEYATPGRRAPGVVLGVLCRARCAAAPRDRADPRVALAEPDALPGRSSTTRVASSSARGGATCRRACARPMRRGSHLRTTVARSSTSASARSARPMFP